MRLIELTKGFQAIVDDEDFERLNKFKWIAWKRPGQDKYYAMRTSCRAKYETSTDRMMARHIIDVPEGFLSDHKNGDSLDNRKINLRIATYQQNSWNSRKRKTSLSRFKGVSKSKNKWSAIIGKSYIGRYPCQFCAALAYDMAALKLHGEYARLNILTGP